MDSSVARAAPSLVSESLVREQEIQNLVSDIESETSDLELTAKELMGAKKSLIKEAEKKVSLVYKKRGERHILSYPNFQTNM